MTTLFLALLAVSVLLHAAAVSALEIHRRRSRSASAPPGFAPHVSIVKPLSGLDPALEDNLESFFRLDYPRYDVVFSFASSEDAAFAAARRVADRHPEVTTSFVIDAREPGRNSKVNRLAAGVSRARGPYFLFSDGDTRVRPDFLTRAMSWFSDPSVGLVSHLFRATRAASLAARLEALYLDGVLRPATAAIARLFGQPCVVGKSILVTRAALQDVGGIARLRDHLAEDFLLGSLVRSAGWRVVLSADEIDTVSGARSGREVWERHRRWALLRRRLGGAGYAVEAVASPAPLAIGAAAASGGASGVVALALALWLVRIVLDAVALRREDRPAWGAALWGPLRDIALAPLFWASLLTDRTTWRGRRLRVGPGTLLLDVRTGSTASEAAPNKIRIEAV